MDLRQADHDLHPVGSVRLVCTGCWMGRAHDFLSKVARLSSSSCVSCKQGLTKETATKACPTQEVDKIHGAYRTLATRVLDARKAETRPPGFGGRCRELEMRRRFLSSVACGSSGATAQNHIVWAVGLQPHGFNILSNREVGRPRWVKQGHKGYQNSTCRRSGNRRPPNGGRCSLVRLATL